MLTPEKNLATTEQRNAYLQLAAAERAAAEDATLENVRRKHEAAAEAWEDLAKPIKRRNPLTR